MHVHVYTHITCKQPIQGQLKIENNIFRSLKLTFDSAVVAVSEFALGLIAPENGAAHL